MILNHMIVIIFQEFILNFNKDEGVLIINEDLIDL